MSEEQSSGEESGPRKSKVKKSEALWLMSFSDLCLVLMCFFVLLLSFSKPDMKKYENVKEGMKSNTKVEKKVENLKTVTQKIKKIIKKKKLQKKVTVTYDADGVAIEFKDGMLFGSGSATANPKFKRTLASVMRAIAKAPKKYSLKLEGHTDDTPMRGGKFKSNWELSAARGITLMNQFTKRGVAQKRMSVIAYAHTKPKVKIRGLKGKKLKKARAANRRVLIRIQ